MEDAPPPSYDEAMALSEGAAKGAASAVGAQSSASAPTSSGIRLMPLGFNVYSEHATSSRLYFMGPTRVDRQFAVVFLDNSRYLSPKPFLTLHDGLSSRAPAIATSTNASPQRSKPWDDFAISVNIAGLPPAEEKVIANDEARTFWHSNLKFGFAVELASGKRQEFEWRESTAAEVIKLGGEPTGWKLVALASEAETLAVWTRNTNSMTKFVRFAFHGRGKTAELGPRWEVMAIVSALSIWHRDCEIAQD